MARAPGISHQAIAECCTRYAAASNLRIAPWLQREAHE